MTAKRTSRKSSENVALSGELIQRLLEFVAFKPNWDGHDGQSVPVAAAARAYALASAASRDFGEPFVAPCGDGSLLMQWDRGNLSVEAFARPSGHLGAAVVTDHDLITEIAVTTNEEVVQLLAYHTMGKPTTMPIGS